MSDSLRRVVTFDPDATKGATIGTDLRGPNGEVLTLTQLRALLIADDGIGEPNELAATIWRLIAEIPANVVEVEHLMSAGLVARFTDGSWGTRQIHVEADGFLQITNEDIDLGDPTLGSAQIAGLSVWGNGTDALSKPQVLEAANDGDILRREGNVLGFGTVPASSITGLVDDLLVLHESIETLQEATYLTLNDETADLPNSLQLMPGTFIAFDTSVPGQITINAEEGMEGPPGPQGPPGVGVDIKGSVPTEADLPMLGNEPGDAYIADDTGHLWVWGGDAWTDAGEIVGPPGPPGADGAEGPQGPQGIQGEQGDIGPEGPQGPQGEQGIQGIPGADGAQGEQGEIGPEGPEGPQGPQGIQGFQGIPGPEGPEGPAGPAGAGATFGNRTALLGLVAINGVATTVARSDSAPALSQAIIPTWTGPHTFTCDTANPIQLRSTGPSVLLEVTNAAAGSKMWTVGAYAQRYDITVWNDAFTVLTSALRINRSATTLTSIELTSTALTHNGKDIRYGNWGNQSNHATFVDFNAAGMPPGATYIQGTANGPGIPVVAQYYHMRLALGADYSTDQYAMDLAIPRINAGGVPYLCVRYNEAGTWGAWQKIAAGSADGLIFQVNTWYYSSEGQARLHFGASSHSYYQSGGSHYFRNASGTDVCTISNTGVMTIPQSLQANHAILAGHCYARGGYVMLVADRYAMIDLSDGYLRLNNAAHYANGIYTPGAFRASGYVLSDTYFGNADASKMITWNAGGMSYGALYVTGTYGGWSGIALNEARYPTFMAHANGTCGIYCQIAPGAGWVWTEDGTTFTIYRATSAPSFNVSSSRAIKRETGYPKNPHHILGRLRPILYQLLEGDSQEQLGMISEEVYEVCPWLSRDGKTISYDRLALLLLADWQQLRGIDWEQAA